MMRRLPADEAAFVVPVRTSASHAAEVAQVRMRLAHARALSEARAELERSLRERLPGLVRSLLRDADGAGDAEARWLAAFEAELTRVRAASSLHVRVHPRWLSVIRQLSSWQTLEATGVSLLLEPDTDLHEQDVLLYTDLGEVDALLDTRIASFVDALLAPRSAP
jgi:flagellar biosynthesis/type III secretory pathway protein FliH